MIRSMFEEHLKLTFHVEVITSLLLEVLNDPLVFVLKIRERAERNDALLIPVVDVVAEASLEIECGRLAIVFEADTVLETTRKSWLRTLQGWALDLSRDQRE
jgi:hypothetical protein